MKQFIPVFKALDSKDIRYVTVGGIATVLNGYPRLTGDIDIVLDLDDTKNCLRALKKLEEIKMSPRAPVKLTDFADPEIRRSWIEEKGMVVFSLSSPEISLIEVDLFVSEPLPFEELWKNSHICKIEEVKIRVASIEDLIKIKTKAGRVKDLDDVENLKIILNAK